LGAPAFNVANGGRASILAAFVIVVLIVLRMIVLKDHCRSRAGRRGAGLLQIVR
jgi:hypothetical protein